MLRLHCFHILFIVAAIIVIHKNHSYKDVYNDRHHNNHRYDSYCDYCHIVVINGDLDTVTSGCVRVKIMQSYLLNQITEF